MASGDFDTHDLYELRLLVFAELEPQSNKYAQVLLTADQFKAVSDAIAKVVRQGGGDREVCELQTGTEEYTLPDLKQINNDESYGRRQTK